MPTLVTMTVIQPGSKPRPAPSGAYDSCAGGQDRRPQTGVRAPGAGPDAVTGPRRCGGPSRDPHAPILRTAEFRFYEELNDFLPPARRKVSFVHAFRGTPSVKDTIEALGVPHVEVDLILVDGRSVDFGHRLEGGERVAVYPVFERFDISPILRLRPAPLRNPRFVADVHLGTLARYLRLLGFDTRWRNDLDDPEIVAMARAEARIILTRDRELLCHGDVTHGHWLRATEPVAQLEETLRALDLAGRLRPYTRCLECNGRLRPLERREAALRVPLQVFLVHRDFTRCDGCGRVYWPGSHRRRLDEIVERARAVGPAR
jgi:uncharacterized protein with PIN domain